MPKKLALLPFLLAAACSTPESTGPNSGTSCNGKCDAVEAIPLVRCAPAGDQVECVSAVPAALPLDGVELLVFETNSSAGVVRLEGDKTFRAAPGAQVRVIVAFSSQDSELFHSLDDSNGFGLIDQTLILDGAKTTTLDMPFDLWRVELKSDVFVDAKLDPYTVSVAPWKADQKDVETIERKGVRLPFVGKEPLTFAVVAPRGAKKLTGKFDVFNDDGSQQKGIAFELTGAGSYVVSASGIVRDTSADPPPAVETPDMTPPVDPVDPNDSDPTCGGDAQPQCRDASGWRSCDDGTVYVSSDELCHTCGGDGQPRCRDASGSSFCDDGTVYASSDELCHTCGGNDELRCRDASGSLFCDEGFVYVGLEDRCFACGSNNQPRCKDANGSSFCSDGFVYSSSDGLCHAQ